MKIKGKILKVLPLQSGTSNNGNEWQKKDFVIETEDEYPKKVCLSAFGKVANVPLEVGAISTFHINLESREYNEKWYTNVNCWKIEGDSQQAPANTPAPATAENFNNDLPDGDGLPF